MRIAIVTVSDRAASGEREDASGPALAEDVVARGWEVAGRTVVPDDEEAIKRALVEIADAGAADVILTTGGTGLSPRDVTPEATLAVVTRCVPGLPEAMRAASLAKTPNAMISRAEAGVRGECLIVNLPGSPKGAVECFEVIAPALEHASRLLKGRRADP
jgi:molybdenum cofactor synthesis domain-containing protein